MVKLIHLYARQQSLEACDCLFFLHDVCLWASNPNMCLFSLSFLACYFFSCVKTMKPCFDTVLLFKIANIIVVLRAAACLLSVSSYMRLWPFSPLCVQWKIQTYRPRDGQLSASPSTPADVRGRHHRNYNETATAKLWAHMLRIHTNNANPHRLCNLALAAVLKHPSPANIISMSSPVPNATP